MIVSVARSFQVVVQGTRYNRFFRLDLNLVLCLDALRHESSDIAVVSSYHTATEDEMSLYASPSARSGLAMLVSRGMGTMGLSMGMQLAVQALHVCGPLLTMDDRLLGLKLYRDAVALYVAPASTRVQDVPLAFAHAAANVGLTSAEFDRYLRSGQAMSQSRVPSHTGTPVQAPPAAFNPSYVYPYAVDRNLPTSSESVGFDFCSSSAATRKALAAKAWQAIEQMADDHQVPAPVQAHLAETKGSFVNCLTTCYIHSSPISLRNTASPQFQRLEALCSEAVRRLPQRFGSRQLLTDSCHFYSLSGVNKNSRTQRMRDNACTMGLCLDETTPFAFWNSLLKTTFAPTIAGVSMDEEQLWSDDQPTPVYRLLQETMAMECFGAVTVWVVDARDIARLANVLKALFILNPSVTKVDLRCERTDKLSVHDALANLIAGWQLGKYNSPRLLLPTYSVVSLDEYDG